MLNQSKALGERLRPSHAPAFDARMEPNIYRHAETNTSAAPEGQAKPAKLVQTTSVTATFSFSFLRNLVHHDWLYLY